MNNSHSRTYIGIYLISTASLTYEIGLTRLFAIAQGYHFAFMVISIALMGIGAGGTMLMLFKWFDRIETARFLAALSAIFSVVTITSFIVANQILFDPVKLAWSRVEVIKILGQYIILSLPFIFSGMIISAAIKSMSERVHRIYLSDMCGAGTGCILILYILSISGGEGAVLMAALLAIAASFLFCGQLFRRNITVAMFQLIAVTVLIFFVTAGRSNLDIKMSPYRELSAALNFPGGRIVETLFTPSGRMDIIDSPAVRAAPGISLTYDKPLPRQIGFTINGGALSTVTDREGDLSFLSHFPSSLSYRLIDEPEVFVVDPGGGMELASAIENGALSATGSESRGAVFAAMRKELAAFSGDLYKELAIEKGLGRIVLKKGGGKFDIIQLPLTDTLGSSSSGIRGLSEEYGLTVESFVIYLEHLKKGEKGGYLSINSYLLPPPRQELKILSTAVASLKMMGIKDAAQHILAIRSWGVITILVKKGNISSNEIALAKKFCIDEGFDLVWYPGMKETEANIYNRFPSPIYHNSFRTVLDPDTREDFLNDYIFDVTPSTDDSPFFGRTFKMDRMKETYESVGKKWGILIEGGYLLPWVLLQSALASVILIVSPLLFTKIKKVSLNLLAPITFYFAAIGIGFIFVEITLMQMLMPVLGEPVYAISAVLFSILISSGIGSYLSGRFRIVENYSANIILILPLLIVVYTFLIGSASDFMSGLDLVPRFISTFCFLFPLGLSMGVPFPSGMSILGQKRNDLIPWAWCINGSFSVISATLVMIVALTFGFTSVNIFAAICYFIAWTALLKMQKVL